MRLADLALPALLAYLTVLVQVGVLGHWPILGGVPNLIALGAVAWIVLDRREAGLVWIGVGGLLLDLLLPARIGLGTLSLLVGYGLVLLLLRRVVSAPEWWLIGLLGLGLVGLAELPLTLVTSQWRQLGLDLVAAAILLVPLSLLLVRRIAPHHQGLWVA